MCAFTEHCKHYILQTTVKMGGGSIIHPCIESGCPMQIQGLFDVRLVLISTTGCLGIQSEWSKASLLGFNAGLLIFNL